MKNSDRATELFCQQDYKQRTAFEVAIALNKVDMVNALGTLTMNSKLLSHLVSCNKYPDINKYLESDYLAVTKQFLSTKE